LRHNRLGLGLVQRLDACREQPPITYLSQIRYAGRPFRSIVVSFSQWVGANLESERIESAFDPCPAAQSKLERICVGWRRKRQHIGIGVVGSFRVWPILDQAGEADDRFARRLIAPVDRDQNQVSRRYQTGGADCDSAQSSGRARSTLPVSRVSPWSNHICEAAESHEIECAIRRRVWVES